VASVGGGGGWLEQPGSSHNTNFNMKIKIHKTLILHVLDICMKMVSHTVKKILIQVLENWVEYLDVTGTVRRKSVRIIIIEN
jgi:hypothetical protein